MKYIIMCGGPWSYKPLSKINNEPLVARTIRLLRENGIEDIAISTNDERYDFGVPILHHDNSLNKKGFIWLKTYYPMSSPVCYIHGDVFFSPQAIKTIVETKTDSIEFFASAPPFSKEYIKRWAEPFAYKVEDTAGFFEAVRRCNELDRAKRFKRSPATAWELWQVIKNTPLNRIDYTNYTAINDYSVDIDTAGEAKIIESRGYK